MQDSGHPQTPPSRPDEVLLERLGAIARERDRVPEDVLAAARALFPRSCHHDEA